MINLDMGKLKITLTEENMWEFNFDKWPNL